MQRCKKGGNYIVRPLGVIVIYIAPSTVKGGMCMYVFQSSIANRGNRGGGVNDISEGGQASKKKKCRVEKGV